MIDDAVQIKSFRSPTDNCSYMSVKISDIISEYSANAVVHEIVRLAAARYVEENYAAIAAKLDQNAIANLAIAEASKKIAEEIQRQPNIIERTNTEIYQRGVFGGVRRVR